MKTNTAADVTTGANRTFTPFGDFMMLAKLRLNALVVFTTAGGYLMAHPEPANLARLGWTCLGTTLVASGAAAINQVHEWDTDRLMRRTRLRPIADGRMSRTRGTAIAAALSLAGLLVLATSSNLVAASVALATLVSYAALYTPLKRRTSLATVVGALPRAQPPLIGWAAVTGSVGGVEPWSLFLIGFFWQLPHVLAISWIYRDEYARAGIPVLPVLDPHGALTGRQAVLWAGALVPFSLVPYLVGLSGAVYATGVLVLGLVQLTLAIRFLVDRSVTNARMLFFASIAYLPLLWMLMVVARR
jgi:protoheme IX farnesyltransferase